MPNDSAWDAVRALVESHDAAEPIAGHRVRAFVFELRRCSGRSQVIDAFLEAWSALERAIVEGPPEPIASLRTEALARFDQLRISVGLDANEFAPGDGSRTPT